MLNIEEIRKNKDKIKNLLRYRTDISIIDALLLKDDERKALVKEKDDIRKKRNEYSKDIAKLKKENLNKEAEELIEKVNSLKISLGKIEERLSGTEDQFYDILYSLPNIPDDSVPQSRDENEKRIIRTYRDKPVFDFKIRDHIEISKIHKLFDFQRASKIAKSFFPMYWGTGAFLERALLNYMMDKQTRKGYLEISPPHLANNDTLFTSGQLPKFEDDLFKCERDNLYLIPTSEVPLVSIHRDETLNESELPKKYCAYTPCYRREAGSWGKDSKGLIRIHQFNKIELVIFSLPGQSFDLMELLLRDAEDILIDLDLHYRTALLVSCDLAHQSAKTYDLEVYIPSLDIYKEVSSCSNCTDFQSRRGNIKYRPMDNSKARFLHTLNSSGLATTRLMVAMLEQNQLEDGSINIPEALWGYTGGLKVLKA